jgi:hypothetical protein
MIATADSRQNCLAFRSNRSDGCGDRGDHRPTFGEPSSICFTIARKVMESICEEMQLSETQFLLMKAGVKGGQQGDDDESSQFGRLD